jgi:hypothetical protein
VVERKAHVRPQITAVAAMAESWKRVRTQSSLRSNTYNCYGRLQAASAACERGVLRATVMCCKAACDLWYCKAVVLLHAWVRSNAPSAVERTVAGIFT